MSSILTNNSAIVALQTIKAINSNLNRVQSDISTGKAIGSAKDNAAVWAISKVMESDVKGFKAISESLSLGSSTIAVAREAAESVTDILKTMKAKIVSAQQQNMDRSKLQTDIDQAVQQIGLVVNGAQFSGMNLVQGQDAMQILASLDRDASGTVSASQISVARNDLTSVAGTLGQGTLLTANVTPASASATATGLSAKITLATAANWSTGALTLTIGNNTLTFAAGVLAPTAGSSQDVAASNLAAHITAAGIAGITAQATGGVVTITSTSSFDATSIALAGLAGTAAGTHISEVNGTAVGGTTTTTAAIAARAQTLVFAPGAQVNEGDGYRVTVAGKEYVYVASKGQGWEDVAKGLKMAIDGGQQDGISTKAVKNAAGAWTLMIDNSGTSAASIAVIGRAGGEAAGGLFGLGGINVMTDTSAAAALTNIENLINRAIDASSSFGSAQSRLDIQSGFVNKLSDALTSGIGTLVDADMEEASARLQALQVQQQLGIQALSIANQQPQNLLALFR